MSGRYQGVVRGITPSTTDDNWTLAAGASELAVVTTVHWGGEVTTSTAVQTRVARSSGQTGNATLGNTERLHPYDPATNLVRFVTTFATTQPTLEAGDLFAESWNAHGGVLRVRLDPGEEFVLIGAATELCVSCRNAVGTPASTYGVFWAENG